MASPLSLTRNANGRSRKIRTDAFPEFTLYRDAGCPLHPSCLSCPEPLCVYDMPIRTRNALADPRPQRARDLRAAGFSVASVAATLNISRRQLFRLLKTFPAPS